LSIYTSPGCSACAHVKELCIKEGIKFKCYDRKDYSEYVNKNTGGCKFVPNIFNSLGDYIGGNEDMIEIINNISLNK
jgi:glutaredoxin